MVGDDIKEIIVAVQLLYSVALRHNWLIRGGVAYGKHWKESNKNNLFIASEALVKAVLIEKKIKKPVIAISEEIKLGIEFWVPHFADGLFVAPLLYHEEIVFVNPFNKYWFKSAEIHIQDLLKKHPQNEDKYLWFLSLIESINRDDVLVPPTIIQELLELGVIKVNY